ncbi:hypothetical protein RJ639_024907 [Escallonia herrerae]|uniref:GAG-pre-integrase domain-containing protein n=1 Tax=Escallonia herrerae TaxID=1293975 RepID=A0AA88UXP0_9ASTE|nr:hypothetical protein RJ639_024907 [Escallonia herrerae]
MMTDLQAVGGMKKLNNNYNTWSTCMISYMQGQDLWEVVNGSEVTQPEAEDANGMLRKWKIKPGKAMFALKTTVEEDVLEHIRATTLKQAWDTFTKLFSKKNDTRLQLLESELLSIAQRDMTVAQYFHKVKMLCREISELDPQAPIGEMRMKQIIIHGLRPKYRGFVAAVQGWQTQPSLVEFENLLAGQEALAKQMGGASLKGQEEALYANNGRWNSKQHGAEEENLTFTAITSNRINYEKDWIVDSGCSNHMTGDVEKLQNLSDYKGSRVVVTANNSKLPIAHVGSAIVSPQSSDDEVPLQNVYHVPGMKNNLLSVAQLTSSGHFVLFGPQDVKVYRDLEIIEEPMIKGQMLESVYVLSAETAYVDKARRNKTADLWHMRLSHVSYSKLDVMMKKSMLKGLPQIEVRIDTVCAGCHKMDKKAIRCIFVGYDNQRKGWRCSDPVTGKCYTSRNVVFDEASLWWSSDKEVLPDSDVFKEALESSQIHLSLDEVDGTVDEGNAEEDVAQNPWQTGVYQQPSEEVGVMSRYMQNTKKLHLEAVRGILRYVKGTLDYEIIYKKGGDCKLVGFCDADYAGDHDTRRSTTGYIFTLGSGVVSWCSKRQPTMSLSTIEAEYRAAAMAAQESTWILQLLEDLHKPIEYPISLYCDNLSAKRLAENPVFHARTKHVEVHYHFIREKVLQEEIELEHVRTKNQVADLLTKSLSENKFQSFCRQLGMANKGGASVEGEY